MLARKFASYRLHIAGITENKQKYLIFIKILVGLQQSEEKINMKNEINS